MSRLKEQGFIPIIFILLLPSKGDLQILAEASTQVGSSEDYFEVFSTILFAVLQLRPVPGIPIIFSTKLFEKFTF